MEIQPKRILISGSALFKEQKEEVIDQLKQDGHEALEACEFYALSGKGQEGDRAIEKLLTPLAFRRQNTHKFESAPDPVNALLVITDITGYCGVITTIRIGFCRAHNLPVYSLGKLRDNDYQNYIKAAFTLDQFLTEIKKPDFS